MFFERRAYLLDDAAPGIGQRDAPGRAVERLHAPLPADKRRSPSSLRGDSTPADGSDDSAMAAAVGIGMREDGTGFGSQVALSVSLPG